jgi:hypothetical protein
MVIAKPPARDAERQNVQPPRSTTTSSPEGPGGWDQGRAAASPSRREKKVSKYRPQSIHHLPRCRVLPSELTNPPASIGTVAFDLARTDCTVKKTGCVWPDKQFLPRPRIFLCINRKQLLEVEPRPTFAMPGIVKPAKLFPAKAPAWQSPASTPERHIPNSVLQRGNAHSTGGYRGYPLGLLKLLDDSTE